MIHSFSSDELSAINRLRYTTFKDFIQKGVVEGDFHPAGVQLFEKFWTSLVGSSEIALRFPFVILGVLSVILTYCIGNKYISKNAGIIGATLLAITTFPIIHSELARPYSPGLFFVLLSTWYYLKFFHADFSNKKTKYLAALGLGISLALTMYTHYFAFMLVGFMGIIGLFFIKKENLLFYFMAGIISLLLYLPHVAITMHHLGIEGGLGWLGKPDNMWIFHFLFFAFNESVFFILLLLVLIIASLFLKKTNDTTNQLSKKTLLLLALWFFGIYIFAFVFSYLSSPILKFPVMLFPLPFLFLLIGSFFSNLNKKAINLIFITLTIGGLYSTLVEKDLFGNRHFGLIKEIAEPMVKWRKKYGKKNIVTYMNVNNPNYLNYYAIPLGDSLTFDKDVLEFDEDRRIRKELLTEERPYCIIGYSSRTTLPQTLETCLEFYPYIVENHSYYNSAVILLSKNKSDQNKDLHKITLASFDPKFPIKKWMYKEELLNDTSYLSDAAHPFGPSFSFQKKDLKFKDKNYLKISIVAEGKENCQILATIKATRNLKPVKNLDNKPLWIGHDLQNMLLNPVGNNQAYFAFHLPKEIKSTDQIKINFWNKNGVPVKIFEIKIDQVEDLF